MPSQGQLYLRMEWDKSRVLWGNYHTAVTGNEFAQYNRSLHGAQYLYRSMATTTYARELGRGTLESPDRLVRSSVTHRS